MEVSINKKRYSWADIRVHVFGRTLEAITGINYEDRENIDPVYGRGKKPVGYTQTQYMADGSITLLIDEIVGIQKALPPGMKLQDIPAFDITVAYEDESGLIVTDRLRGCKFKNNGRTSGAGDTGAVDKEIELFILEINFNVA